MELIDFWEAALALLLTILQTIRSNEVEQDLAMIKRQLGPPPMTTADTQAMQQISATVSLLNARVN